MERHNAVQPAIVSTQPLLQERAAAARAPTEKGASHKKRAPEPARAELRARGPLKEETIRLSYADPEELTKTLQGILGIPPEGVQAQIAPPMYPPTQGPPNPEVRPVPSLITSTPPPLAAAPAGGPPAAGRSRGVPTPGRPR